MIDVVFPMLSLSNTSALVVMSRMYNPYEVTPLTGFQLNVMLVEPTSEPGLDELPGLIRTGAEGGDYAAHLFPFHVVPAAQLAFTDFAASSTPLL